MSEAVRPEQDEYGLKEIPINEFAQWQQFIISATPAELQTQDITSAAGKGGQILNTGLQLAGLIPEVGPFIELGTEVTNALLSVFYHPKATIQQRLKKAGIDIFQDDLYLTNPEYPVDSPEHFIILLPNGMFADGKDQARYIALIYYMTVLGNNIALWINKITPKERNYLFPSDQPKWPVIFGQLAIIHGHNNPYLVKAKFNE